ncbi:deubiquitination-protection protein dph1 [Histoplasma ohiense]|nr:deubiquitination-protection protein dph1 [Histoplasma ohiense (nom. inval.)]
MAEDSSPGEQSPITFHVKSSNDVKYTLTLDPSTTIADLKAKLAGSDYADVPAERQRLIYSGRVLKDGDTLATHNVKDGHSIHLVKSAISNQRPAPPSQGSSTTSGDRTRTPGLPNVPTNIAAGTGNNPLAGLTGARYAGFTQLPGAGMFGPDGGMGPPPDSEEIIRMLENPQFQSSMNEALQNPQLIDMMIQQNPMLLEMGPGVRQMMQSPLFRRMLTDPNVIRQMTQMQRAMGIGGGGGAGGGSAFPAPGVTNTTPEESRGTHDNQTPSANTANDTANMFNLFGMPGAQGGAGGGNPFAALFGATPPSGATLPTQTPTGDNNAANTGTAPQPNPYAFLLSPAYLGQPQTNANNQNQQQQPQNPSNPFAALQDNPFIQDPNLFTQMLQTLNGGGQNPPSSNIDPANNPLATLFGGRGAGSPAPQDTRPPEERYAEQLRQLNDMGFYEFERNIEALRRTGGSVQGAVEYLLNHP